MTYKVLKTIEQYGMIKKGDTVGVGLSGGADSVALTHILASNREKLGIKELKAVHLHHGIRGEEADRDLNFVADFCRRLGIELLPFKADIPSLAEKSGESIEECARRIRYECFEKAGCDKFATAHNLNDNMETFFFNLSRGTSLSGMTSIPYVRDFYIRPLLDCTRKEIENYISENGLDFVTDSTNLSDDYTRNKIRHNILPLFYELNPSFDKAFSKCLSSVYMSKNYIDNTAKELFEKSKCDGKFDCSVFKTEPDAIRYAVLSLILKSGNVNNISREHLLQVDNIIKNGGSADLPNKIKVTVERNRLYFGELQTTPEFEIAVDLNTESVETPVGSFDFSVLSQKDLQNLNKVVLDNLIDCDKISGKLVIRNRHEGDKVRFLNRGMTKTLKKLFNEFKIPVSNRSKIAILSDDCGIVWMEHFGVTARCKPTEKTERYLKIEKRGI